MHIQENVALAPFTTLRIGGPARYFVATEDELDLWEAHHFAVERELPLFVLGGGSNLVVADAGFAGLVMHLAMPRSIVHSEEGDDVVLDVSGGTGWDDLVRHACALGLGGIECLAGIPGSVGASPVQNIGAYGQEVSGVIDSVRAFDRRDGAFHDLPAERCGFAYRRSIFNSTGQGLYIVSSVRFRLRRDARPNLAYADLAPLRGTDARPLDVYHAVRAIRDRKGMLLDPGHPHADSRSAGSFFKNPIVPLHALDRIAGALGLRAEAIPHWPVAAHPESADPSGTVPAQDVAPDPRRPTRTKLPAAWLIERAGFPKGFALGPVGISTRHTLALVNRTGTASCAELFALRDLIVHTVHERFGVGLEQEPVLLG